MEKTVSLTPEELGEVWGLIEEHIKIEEKTQRLAEESFAATRTSKGILVEHLLEDEKKHNLMLERLAAIQKGMYPYG